VIEGNVGEVLPSNPGTPPRACRLLPCLP
jgi:hypothetical protein